jgi:hypothetical protein
MKQFKTCREFFLKNGDKCTIGQFVITQNPNVVGSTFVARVEEILQVVGSVADYSGFPDGVLLQSADVNRPAVEYHMPHIDLLNRWSFVRFEVCTLSTQHPVTQAYICLVSNYQDILCTVNVQHNCAKHQCTTTDVRHIYQERERIEQTSPMVSHMQHPEDIMLNTAQMRDAAHVQVFRLRSPNLDAESIVTASAAREVALQKAARKVSDSTSTAKAPTTQQLGHPRRLAALQELPHASTSGTS